jgi:hypothetical protein
MPTTITRFPHWTAKEDRLLRSMANTGKRLTLMTAKLKRPISVIKRRAQDLSVPLAKCQRERPWGKPLITAVALKLLLALRMRSIQAGAHSRTPSS